MVFPWQLSLSLARYILRQRLARRRRYPLVLMLEPTLRCNLACAGCGRIREAEAIGHRELTVDECLAAIDEAGAPILSLTGGEPLLHPEIGSIVRGAVARRVYVYLCTNGLQLQPALHRLAPSPYLSFVVHLDGLAQTHDRLAGRGGVFAAAMAGVAAAKAAGFQVRTNTTVYRGADPKELSNLFSALAAMGVDGMMVSPAFGYEQVGADIFPTRAEATGLIGPILAQHRWLRFYSTPLYRDLLSGRVSLPCSPWSTPTRNPRGWRQPCYLLADGYCASHAELMQTPWERYGPGNDPRCAHCMMHSGFEASTLEVAAKSPRELARLMVWHLLW
jgi:hopanoid biosynthesis associated radical SAM protein HpnH